MILKNVKFLLFLFSILGHTTVYGCKQPLMSKMASSNCFERKKWDIQIMFRLPTTAPSKSASLETNNLSRPQDFLQTSPQYRRDVVLLWMCKIISWLKRYLNLVGQDRNVFYLRSHRLDVMTVNSDRAAEMDVFVFDVFVFVRPPSKDVAPDLKHCSYVCEWVYSQSMFKGGW